MVSIVPSGWSLEMFHRADTLDGRDLLTADTERPTCWAFSRVVSYLFRFRQFNLWPSEHARANSPSRRRVDEALKLRWLTVLHYTDVSAGKPLAVTGRYIRPM